MLLAQARVRIRSRRGNIVLAALGLVFAVSSTLLLVYYLATAWDASSLTDNALQLMLLFGAGMGALFVSMGRENLRP